MIELERVWPTELEMARLAKRAEMPNLPERAASGEIAPFKVQGHDLHLLLSVGLVRDTGARALWVAGLAGNASWRPKSNVGLMRAVLSAVEHIARLTECSEVRIEATTRAGWKLRLLTKMGFTPVMSIRGMVMRKGLADGI